MLLLFKHPRLPFMYGETSAVDMPQGKCCSDAPANQERMGGPTSSARCSQTLSLACQMLRECTPVESVQTGRFPPAAVQCHLVLTADPVSHFPARSGVAGKGDDCESQLIIMLSVSALVLANYLPALKARSSSGEGPGIFSTMTGTLVVSHRSHQERFSIAFSSVAKAWFLILTLALGGSLD